MKYKFTYYTPGFVDVEKKEPEYFESIPTFLTFCEKFKSNWREYIILNEYDKNKYRVLVDTVSSGKFVVGHLREI